MPVTTIKIEIADVRRPLKWQSIVLSLQPGAIYTIVPSPVLARMGIQPYIKDKLLMADGRRVMRDKGAVKFRYQKKIGGSDVIFGRPGDPVAVGALTLGSLGLQLDPQSGELKPLPMILGGWRPERRTRAGRHPAKRQSA